MRRGCRGLQVVIFEQKGALGYGMPYAPDARFHSANIASREIPDLGETLVDWVRTSECPVLQAHQLFINEQAHQPITDESLLPRSVVGRYFESQGARLCAQLADAGNHVDVRLGHRVEDVLPLNTSQLLVIARNLAEDTVVRETADSAIIAIGHTSPQPSPYLTPYPIDNVLKEDATNIHLIGASLTAFDVVVAVGHHRGRWQVIDNRTLRYEPYKPFQIVLHSRSGGLPHLQYQQIFAQREYGRVAGDYFRQHPGRFSLDDFFRQVCLPPLRKALLGADLSVLVEALDDPKEPLKAFTQVLNRDREKRDFGTYKRELEGYFEKELYTSDDSWYKIKSDHWKEVLDDCLYDLNFHVHRLSEEDQFRLMREVYPVAMNCLAAVPYTTAALIVAMHEAAVLSHARNFTLCADALVVDCVGQRPAFTHPFPKLGACPAPAGGFAIDDHYRLNPDLPHVYDASYAHTITHRPFSCGLPACAQAAHIIVGHLLGNSCS